ncbi:MAG: AAA family ATPase, partial [Butyrivibrio sp.]|nr:AAA family ATPase [Butyrivibrio sp.]
MENNCVYVDKTKYLYDIVTAPKGHYFCARPRRFGKSLAISTLEAIFEGQRDLFKNCYIYTDTEYDWKKYPIIHLDFARANTASIELLTAWIVQTLRSISQKYDVVVHNNDPVLLFGELIEALYNKEQTGVVVLVDEYD